MNPGSNENSSVEVTINIETERKFLVDENEIPSDLNSYNPVKIVQHYLSVGDTEERVRAKTMLNDGRYPFFVSHEDLSDFKKKAIPLWREYINSNRRDINKLLGEFRNLEGKH